MWGVLICGLTPCTPLPAKGYKETASVKELLANLISKKRDTPWACHLCSVYRRGSSAEGVTVSDPISTLDSLKHKESSKTLIHSCNATFLFND